MTRAIVAAAALVLAFPAFAHDAWSNGKRIPDWVKASCCGPADAHHLTPDQVHRTSEAYYEVDGYSHVIPVGAAMPSQDGDYWIFYKDWGLGSDGHAAGQSGVYCFFVPMAF